MHSLKVNKHKQSTLTQDVYNSISLDLLDEPRSLKELINDRYSYKLNKELFNFVIKNIQTDKRNAITPLPENLVAGKNTYVYDAHTYHTKVPPEAIVKLIENYTKSGDIVLDPFCGSGMTGVAAIKVGRKPILIDLSPAATFITYNFVTPVNYTKYMEAIQKILDYMSNEDLKLYGTHCRICGKLVPMEYLVWSYGLICEHCNKEFILWDVARDEHEDVKESKIKKEFNCPHCNKHLEKRKLRRTKLYPVQIGYRCCGSGLKESIAVPDEYDLKVINNMDRSYNSDGIWYPTVKFNEGVNTKQAIAHGLESVDALYTKRNLRAIALLWDIARRWPDENICLKLMFTVTSLYHRVTKLSEFRFWGGSGNTANYNVPMIFNEQNVFKVFSRKAKTIRDYLATWDTIPTTQFCISTQSATDLSLIPNNSIDYIFTDPPFGKNINYSEMNYIWEAWLGVFTDNTNEAIINHVQGKDALQYGNLMIQSFKEMYRVLKQDRCLTVAFHNSSSDVWSIIQNALVASGFTIEKTQTLDKRHGTFKQFVSENAVGYDLIIHCKRNHSLSQNGTINNKKSTYESISKFVKTVIEKSPNEFIVHYLHVNRPEEFDSRKLYSLWLKERLESQETIDLDYEEFRHMLVKILQDLK